MRKKAYDGYDINVMELSLILRVRYTRVVGGWLDKRVDEAIKVLDTCQDQLRSAQLIVDYDLSMAKVFYLNECVGFDYYGVNETYWRYQRHLDQYRHWRAHIKTCELAVKNFKEVTK